MARPVAVVVLALLLVALAGRLASAQDTANADPIPADTTSDDIIGNDDADVSSYEDDVVEAPVGGPVPPGAFPPAPATEEPRSGATAVDVSAIAGVAVAAVAGYFF